MEPILSPVQEVAEVASVNEQDSSWLDLVEQGPSSHTGNDHQETALQTRTPNTLHGSVESRRQVDLPWRRTYPQNELLRIGASVNRVVRKSRSAQEDLSHLHTTGSRALRRSASAYNDILHGTASQRHESLTRRSSSQSEGLQAPIRQPTNPSGDIEWHRARGFARFIKDHASPRSHRVTAGGRIVPAMPNTPPPTFHDEFLDAFLQSETGEQEQGVFERTAMQSHPVTAFGDSVAPMHTVASGNMSYSSLLRIPPGLEVIQVSTEGTIVIARCGTTIYQYELTDAGDTNCKILVQEARRPASQTAIFTLAPGMWSHAGDATLQGQDQSLSPVYSSDLLMAGSAHSPGGFHETSYAPLQMRVENELQQIFLSNHQAMINSCSNSHSQAMVINHIGELKQQLRALNSSQASWTAILLDYERILLVPSALGHAGIKSNQIKRDMISVKIEELMKRKLQIETHLAVAHATELVQMEAEAGQQASSHVLTETDHEGHVQRGFYQYSDIGCAPSEGQSLSALAPSFIPGGQGPRVAQLARVESEQQGNNNHAAASMATEYWSLQTC